MAWILGALTTVLAGTLMLRDGDSLPRVVVFNISALVFLTTGHIAWRRRPGNETGRQIMIIGFLATLPAIAVHSTVPWLVAIGHVIAGSGEIVLVYILLAYPWGRLSTRFDLWAVSALAILFVTIGSAAELSMGRRKVLYDAAARGRRQEGCSATRIRTGAGWLPSTRAGRSSSRRPS